ncbi:MAG: hypothetical protein ACREKH_20205 [Candidatus Rokuibacteriota bacterium]
MDEVFAPTVVFNGQPVALEAIKQPGFRSSLPVCGSKTGALTANSTTKAQGPVHWRREEVPVER